MVVNPWFFYVVYLCKGFKPLLILGALFSFCFGATVCFMEYGTSKKIHNWKAWILASIVIAIFCTLIPNLDTLLLMNASKLVEYQDFDYTIDTIRWAMDYAAMFF